MPTKYEGIRCKSYTLPGIDGGELEISETIDRLSIEVTVRGVLNADSLSVRLSAEQFEALCYMGSLYDGLEVKKPGQQPLPEEPEGMVEEAETAQGGSGYQWPGA